MRFLAVLREPIARDLSSFNHQVHDKQSWSEQCPAHALYTYEKFTACQVAAWRKLEAKNLTFSRKGFGYGVSETGQKLGPNIGWGVYVNHLIRWRQFFPREQIFVVEMVTGGVASAIHSRSLTHHSGQPLVRPPQPHIHQLTHRV